MIALLQRVAAARVEIDGQVVGAIDAGLLALVCAEPADTPATASKLVDKVLKLRVFADAAGKMNRSVVDVGGGLLVVSQFTLAADTRGATARASPGPRHRPRARRCTRRCCAARARVTRWWPAGASGPTCRCTWSTTGR